MKSFLSNRVGEAVLAAISAMRMAGFNYIAMIGTSVGPSPER